MAAPYTQLGLTATPMRRYGDFAGKTDASALSDDGEIVKARQLNRIAQTRLLKRIAQARAN